MDRLAAEGLVAAASTRCGVASLNPYRSQSAPLFSYIALPGTRRVLFHASFREICLLK